MPLRYKLTQREVNNLIKKFLNIKINKINIMLILYHLREAKLLSNAEVRRDVETALQRVGSVLARLMYSNYTQQLRSTLAQLTGLINCYAALMQLF